MKSTLVFFYLVFFLAGLTFFNGCAVAPRYTRSSQKKVDKISEKFLQTGMASYYADKFHGRMTANGETFNMNQLTAAHPSLPFNTKVKVTNLQNGSFVIVRINDRGPFAKGRVIDLSKAAAEKIGILKTGVGKVKIELIETGNTNR